MPRFQGIPVEEQPQRGGRFGGIPVEAEPPQKPQPRKPVILPLKRVEEGQGIMGSSIDFGPSELTESLSRAFTAPRRAITGEMPLQNMPSEAANLAGVVAGGGVGMSAPVRAIAKEAGEGAVTLGMNSIPPIKEGAKAASRAVTTVAQPVIDRFDVEGAIGRTLARRMMQQNPGMTFEQAFAKTQADLAERGEQAVLADTGAAMRKLGRNMAQGSGETAQRAEDVLGKRQAQEKTRVIESVKQNISSKDFYSAAAEAKLARRKSGPLFKRAYENNPNVTSPKLDVMKADPVIKTAMEKGLALERMAATEAGEIFEPTTYGVVVDFNPAGDAVIRQARETPLKLWHATKRGLDKQLRAFRNPLTGKIDEGDPEAAALIGLRKALDDELKTITGGKKGDYAKANRVASDAYRLEDALDYGRSFARGDEEVTQKIFAGLSPKEKDAFRAGVAREMVSMIRKNTSDLTPSQIMAIVKDESGIRKKLEFIVPSQAQFNNLMKDIENNLAFRETRGGIRNVSQTGSIAMEEGAIAADNLAAAGGIAMQAARGNPLGVISNTLQWGMSQLQKIQMPQGTRDKIGEMLLSQDPATKQRALDLIQKARANGWVYAP